MPTCRIRSERLRALFLTALVLFAVGALILRVAQLPDRPLHGDEANQAHRAGVLIETGVYEYDPVEHHGPTLYYLTLPLALLRGQTAFADTDEYTFRLVPALFGVALVLLLIPVADGLGKSAALWAAAFTALSPAFVYYSRYYIQETLLVAFTFAAIACAWRYIQRPRAAWAVGFGIAIGLMHATKETCVLAWFAMAVAAAPIALARLRAARRARGAAPPLDRRVLARHAALAVLVALIVSVVLFSSFFTHAAGPLDSVGAYFPYLHRASADPAAGGDAHAHDHPWPYYLRLLLYTRRAPGPWWSEALILGLAAVGAVAAWRPRQPRILPRFLAIYAPVLAAVYAVIPYKTPWCLLSFHHGFILLAGFGAVALIRLARFAPLRIAVALLIALATLQLGRQAVNAAFEYPADPRNPYVYAHTASAHLRLVQRINDLAAVHPEGRALRVHVITPDGDYWPLPFYLRAFRRVGYFTVQPERPDADVLIVASSIAQAVQERLTDHYHVEHGSLRPGVLFRIYIRQELWDTFMDTRR